MVSQTEARGLSTLPWPEIPLLSASKQHGVQGGKFTDPSYIQSTDPGAVELEGRENQSLTHWELPGHLLRSCLSVRSTLLWAALGEPAPDISLWPGLSSAMTLMYESHKSPQVQGPAQPKDWQVLDSCSSTVLRGACT